MSWEKPTSLSLSKGSPFLPLATRKEWASTSSAKPGLGSSGRSARTVLIFAALFGVPAFAHAQTRTADTVLMSENERGRAFQEELGYADAVIAGDMIYLSGIVAGQAPGEASLEPGFDRVFRQIGRILERAGAGYGDIVEMTSYHTDVVGQVPVLSAVQRRYLGSPPPAWTAIQVVRLLPDNGLAEIRIVARRRAQPVSAGNAQ